MVVVACSSSAPATPANFDMKNLSMKLAGIALGLAALTASAQTIAPFGNLPLYFEADSAARFLAHGRDAQFSVSPTGAQLVLQKSDATRALQMQFIGANPQAQICGDSGLPGKINYFIGNDPAQWRSSVPTFAKVRVAEIYPGINLVYYGNQRQLEYDFTIAAGANPNSIAIHFDGADTISVNAQGELVLKLGGSEILQPKPLIYQTVDGARREIGGGYKILDARSVAFDVGKYDRARPLVIDPVLGYSTYFGGTLAETAWAVALDTNDGSVYIAGQTLSKLAMKKGPPFSTPGAIQEDFAGGKLIGDGFVARFDKTGTNLDYLTYLGGDKDDLVSSVAVDAAGNAFVTGFTDSSNFPTAHALFPNIGGVENSRNKAFPGDAFVAELDSGGSNLLFSTYLGGSQLESGNGIAIDSATNIYVTGLTGSPDFPVTTNAVQNHLAGTNNVFVTEIGAGGSPLIFSTYLGGTNFDSGESIALDAANNIWVTGFTSSTNFPITTNAFTTVLNGGLFKKNGRAYFAYDAFVAKLAPSGASLLYSTFLGSTNNDIGYHIICDAAGNAYVTGDSASPDFPNTETNVPGLYAHGNITGNKKDTGASDIDAFLTKFDPNGVRVYSALFGGKGDDIGYGVGLDASGDVFVVGATTSKDFPTNNVASPFRIKNAGGDDVFVTAFSTTPTNITAMLYSGYLGGKKNDFGYNIAVDPAGTAYIVGQTLSKDFPLTNAFQPFRNGKSDAFLTKIILTP
jgi:Beta-propeller repeat